ncbi:MAG TPA: ABC transporter permease [Gemmatimonadaceae bacterium]|jgi:putative ABC transport system permease protein|nr:ABC transporter permease [Gemmatimonadaceae bacterium]
MRLASIVRQLAHGVRALRNRDSADRTVADEVNAYRDEAVAMYVKRGMSLADAQRAATLDLGGGTAVREQVRTSGWEDVVWTTAADVRHSARRLRNSPGFTVIAVVTLALGIGASTAIFSAVNPILFESLPYPHPEQLVSVSDFADNGSRLDVAFGNFREIAQRSRSFDALAVFRGWQPSLVGNSNAEQLSGQRVGSAYLRALGVLPRIGRDFVASDDRPNGPNVAILSDGLWKRRFGADPSIVGRTILISGYLYTIIGVMPAGFDNVTSPNASIWALLQYDPSLPPNGREWGHHLRMIGRLHPGVGLAQAMRDLAVIAKSPSPEFARVPWATMSRGMLVRSLQDDVTGGVKAALLAVLGAVTLLLAIACVNVVNLLIARGSQRRAEFAMRVALGAGRGRLVRQVIAESMVLSLLGGAVGMAVAVLGVRALVLISPPGLPRVDAIRVNGAVLAFGVVLTTALGVLVGVIPALAASANDPRSGLQQATQRVTRGHQRTRQALVVGEVSLALVLLVGAGLLLRSLERLFAIAPGFDPRQVVSMQIQASDARFADSAVTNVYFKNVLDAVRRVPGVRVAGLTSQLPLSGDLDGYGASIDTDRDKREKSGVLRYAVSPGYLETLRIPLVRGRVFDTSDDAGAPLVALISESMARSRFATTDPIGRRVQVGGDDAPWLTIVGVVGDVKQRSLASDETEAVYMPTTQWPYTDRVLSLVVRAQGNPAALTAAVRGAVWSVDRNEPIVRAATMDNVVASTASDRHFTFVLFESFALVALVLAATGIFGVLSGSVAERMREIGVRAALGATRGSLLGLVLRQGMTLTAIGVAVGVAGAIAASRALVTLLFGVSRLDPITYVGVIALLAGVSALACWIPAWRAASVDPVSTLRAE